MRIMVPSLRGRDLNPFEGFAREFDDMMRDFGRQFPATWSPAFEKGGLAPLDVSEGKEAVEIATELPGMGEEDVKLTVEGQALVIAGEKKTETEKTDKEWRVTERSYGSFRRIVPLTFTPSAEKIHAAFDKGVLRIKVDKPVEMIEKKVEIPIRKAG